MPRKEVTDKDAGIPEEANHQAPGHNLLENHHVGNEIVQCDAVNDGKNEMKKRRVALKQLRHERQRHHREDIEVNIPGKAHKVCLDREHVQTGYLSPSGHISPASQLPV